MLWLQRNENWSHITSYFKGLFQNIERAGALDRCGILSSIDVLSVGHVIDQPGLADAESS